MSLENGCCGADTVALAASRLNFPVLSQARLLMHERAVAAVYKLLDKMRTLSELFLHRCGHESNARVLEATMRRLLEWSSTYYMIARHLRIRVEGLREEGWRGGDWVQGWRMKGRGLRAGVRVRLEASRFGWKGLQDAMLVERIRA